MTFREKLKGNGVKLMDLIDIRNNERFLMSLETNGVITHEHYQTIEGLPNNAKQVSKLVEILNGRADNLFSKFIDSLYDSGLGNVVEKLWPSYKRENVADAATPAAVPVEPPKQQPPQQPQLHAPTVLPPPTTQPGPQPLHQLLQPAAAKPPQQQLGDAEQAENLVITDVTVTQCSEAFYAKNKRGVYTIDRNQSPKKTAFVINIYKHPSKPRHGTDVDRDLLCELFRGLGFNVRAFNDFDNLTAKGFEKVLDEIASDVSNKESDCLVLFVLSHGNIIGTDEVIECSDGEPFKKNKIIDRFSDEQCKALKGKPRLIFLASCRGTKDEYANQKDAVDVPPDFFVGLPCQEGYTAIRNPLYGSRYIRAIVYVLMRNAYNTELEALMDEVNTTLKSMTKFDTEIDGNLVGQTQTAVNVNNLNLHFFFFP